MVVSNELIRIGDKGEGAGIRARPWLRTKSNSDSGETLTST